MSHRSTIQKHTHDGQKNDEPLYQAYVPVEGTQPIYVNTEHMMDDMPSLIEEKMNRTSLSNVSIFNMVAELAMWQADLAIWFA
eukprot:4360059-Amphidinium_carterae.1